MYSVEIDILPELAAENKQWGFPHLATFPHLAAFEVVEHQISRVILV